MVVKGRANPQDEPLFPSCNANGNVTDLVDTNGAVVAHYEYDPYGNTIAQSGDLADANPYRFSSKYWDGEIGFYYYGYRFYSPGLGRWVSRDPIDERGGLNIYAFVINDPPNIVDNKGCMGIPNPYSEQMRLCGLWNSWFQKPDGNDQPHIGCKSYQASLDCAKQLDPGDDCQCKKDIYNYSKQAEDYLSKNCPAGDVPACPF
jgi:RHS repeat-associated protein